MKKGVGLFTRYAKNKYTPMLFLLILIKILNKCYVCLSTQTENVIVKIKKNFQMGDQIQTFLSLDCYLYTDILRKLYEIGFEYESKVIFPVRFPQLFVCYLGLSQLKTIIHYCCRTFCQQNV